MPFDLAQVQHLSESFKVYIGTYNGYNFPMQPFILGKGYFATVQLCTKENVNYAAKRLHMRVNGWNEAFQRLTALANVVNGHDRFVRTFESFTTQRIERTGIQRLLGTIEDFSQPIIIQEFMPGGTLYDMMLCGPFSESFNRKIIKQLLNGIAYMHSLNYGHLDLNPSNILFTSRNPFETQVKISGFCAAREFGNYPIDNLSIQYITRHPFSSPELLLKKRCRISHDMWSIGVIIYYLMTHKFPFCRYVITDRAKENMLNNTYNEMQGTSDACKDLVRKLLRYVPEERLSAQDALYHHWFRIPDAQINGVNQNLRDAIGFGEQYSPEKPTALVPELTQSSPFRDITRNKALRAQARFENQLLNDNNRVKALQIYLSNENTYAEETDLYVFGGDVLNRLVRVYGYHGSYKFPDEEEVLGIGSYGSVLACYGRVDNTKYAAKVAVCNEFDSNFRSLTQEAENMRNLGTHGNLVKFYDGYIAYGKRPFGYAPKLLILNIYEFMDGDSLQHVCLRTTHEEYFYREMMRQMLQGIEYIHSRGYMHCDIKPDNCLLSNWEAGSGTMPVLKICDFGSALKIDNEVAKLADVTYTIQYASPELIFKKRCNKMHDMWSTGVSMYQIIMLECPFIKMTNHEQRVSAQDKEALRQGVYTELEFVSNECKDLLRKLLKMNPSERLTATQALRHRWFSLAETALYGANVTIDVAAKAAMLHEPRCSNIVPCFDTLPVQTVSESRRSSNGSGSDGSIVAVAQNINAISINYGDDSQDSFENGGSDGSIVAVAQNVNATSINYRDDSQESSESGGSVENPALNSIANRAGDESESDEEEPFQLVFQLIRPTVSNRAHTRSRRESIEAPIQLRSQPQSQVQIRVNNIVQSDASLDEHISSQALLTAPQRRYQSNPQFLMPPVNLHDSPSHAEILKIMARPPIARAPANRNFSPPTVDARKSLENSNKVRNITRSPSRQNNRNLNSQFYNPPIDAYDLLTREQVNEIMERAPVGSALVDTSNQNHSPPVRDTTNQNHLTKQNDSFIPQVTTQLNYQSIPMESSISPQRQIDQYNYQSQISSQNDSFIPQVTTQLNYQSIPMESSISPQRQIDQYNYQSQISSQNDSFIPQVTTQLNYQSIPMESSISPQRQIDQYNYQSQISSQNDSFIPQVTTQLNYQSIPMESSISPQRQIDQYNYQSQISSQNDSFIPQVTTQLNYQSIPMESSISSQRHSDQNNFQSQMSTNQSHSLIQQNNQNLALSPYVSPTSQNEHSNTSQINTELSNSNLTNTKFTSRQGEHNESPSDNSSNNLSQLTSILADEPQRKKGRTQCELNILFKVKRVD